MCSLVLRASVEPAGWLSASRDLLHSLAFFFTPPATTDIYTLSLHDALPISFHRERPDPRRDALEPSALLGGKRSEEHTSELQSLTNLVCRLLLEKKNN